MRLGVSAFAWTAEFAIPHLDLLPLIKEQGVECVEIPMFEPAALPVETIREACNRNGLTCTVCAILPSRYNPISPERETRFEAIQHLRRCIESAAAMGAKLLCGPVAAPIGYFPGHRPTRDEWTWATEAFQSLADVLNSCDITLAIEPVNRSETYFLRTAQEAGDLCERIASPRIGVTIDTFHANIEESSIVGAMQSLGPRLRHVHASENDRGPLGRGHIPFASILEALRNLHFDGLMMIEGFGYDSKEINAPGYLWGYPDVSPEVFLSESVRFLRELGL